MTEVEQGHLSLKVSRPIKESVSDDVLAAKPSLTSAISLAIAASGLEDKQIYIELGIDAGHWSRICKGSANFPQDKLSDFMDLVGNEIPLRWLAMHRGYGLVRLKSHLEAELEVERSRNAALELKLKHFEEFQKLGVG